MTDFNAIASDLDLCDMVEAFGKGAAKRKARAHRKTCFKAIADQNRADGLADMSDDEILAALTA